MMIFRQIRGFALVAMAAMSFAAWDSAHAGSLLITGTPAAAFSGQAYKFKPTVTGAAKGKTLTFKSKDVPGWAKFDAKTGTVTGTPGKADANQRDTMYIVVKDGVSTAWMMVTIKVREGKKAPAVAVTAPVVKKAVTLTWKAPNANIDNTPINSTLAGYRVVYGTAADKMNTKLEVAGAAMTSIRVEDLTAGTYFFAVKAYNKDGVESDLSTVMWKTL